MSEHSLLSASAAHRWTTCPGSIAASLTLPYRDDSSVAAEEGTALHAVLEHCVKNDIDACDVDVLVYRDHGKTKTIRPNDEQAEAVQTVLDQARSLPGKLFSEMKVCYGYAIGQPPSKAFGTLDIASLEGTILHVLDAKFGRHFVSQIENPQMLLYAIGAVDSLKALGDKITDVYLHIGQPRAGSQDPEGWHITAGELADWVKWFRKRAREVERAVPMPPVDTPAFNSWYKEFLKPSDEGCRFCPFAPVCPALKKEFDEMVKNAKDAASADEFELVDATNEALSSCLSKADRVERYIKAVRSEATRRISDGNDVPEWKLVKGRAGNRKWADEDKALKRLLSHGLSQDDSHSPRKILSPAKAEKALKKVLDKEEAKEVIELLVTRNPPKPSLVPSDRPGEPWVGSADLTEFEIQKGK